MLETLMEVAYLPEFVLDPAGFDPQLKLAERGRGEVIVFQGFEGSFGSQHPAFDGEMNPLQALRIEQPGRVADDHPAVAGQRRNRPPAAVGQSFRSVANHLAALEQGGDEPMLLEILQHVLRIEARVEIVEPGDETERDDVVPAAVDPGPTIFFRSERPPHGVDDFTASDAARRQFP